MSYPVMNTAIPWSLVKSGFGKTLNFEGNILQESAAARGNSGIIVKPYPTWDFEVDLNKVCGGESIQYSVLSMFLGCFMATAGRGGLFLFTDPNDSSVDDTGLTTPQSCMLNVTPSAAAPMGQLGDGASTQFQLARNIDQGVDILQQVSNVKVFVNGALTTPSSISSTGVVTFSAAPANNAQLTWQGGFQYLCRFKDDTLKGLARVSKNSSGFLWDCDRVAFSSEFV